MNVLVCSTTVLEGCVKLFHYVMTSSYYVMKSNSMP